MPRLPGAQQVPQTAQTRDPGVRVPAPVDSGLGAMSQALGGLSEVAVRVQERRDGIRRGRAEASFTEYLTQLSHGLQDADLFDEDIVMEARQNASQQMEQLLEGFQGRSREVAEHMLRPRLMNFETQLAATSIAAAHQEQQQRFGDSLNMAAAMMQEDPSLTTRDIMGFVEERLEGLGITGRRAELMKQAAMQQLTGAQIDNLITNGEFGKAREILMSSPNLPVQARQEYNRKLTAVERGVTDKMAEARGHVAAAQFLMGPGASPEAVQQAALSLAGIPGMKFQTVGNDVWLLDAFTGAQRGMIPGPSTDEVAMTPEEVAASGLPPGTIAYKAPGKAPKLVYQPDPVFGKGESARMRSALLELTPVILSGAASDEEKRRFRISFLSTAGWQQDPTTQQWHYVEHPTEVQQAYAVTEEGVEDLGRFEAPKQPPPGAQTGSSRVPAGTPAYRPPSGPEGFVAEPDPIVVAQLERLGITIDHPRLEQYNQEFAAAAQETGLSEDLLRAVAMIESSGKPAAVSNAGAQGLMQLMPSTAASLGVEDPSDPAQNILGGAQYLNKLIAQFDDLGAALAAYNWGQGNVRRLMNQGRFPEGLPPGVRDYVAKVTTAMNGASPFAAEAEPEPRIPGLPPGPVSSPAQAMGAVEEMFRSGAVKVTGQKADTPTIPEEFRFPSLVDPRMTVADMVKDGVFTGPIPALKRALSRIGYEIADEATSQSFVTLVELQLVRALQTNPRFAVAERQDIIERVLNLDPGLLKRPNTFLSYVYGIHQFLNEMENELVEVVEGRLPLFVPKPGQMSADGRVMTSRETTAHARDTLTTIRNVRDLLGPQMFRDPTTLEEFLDRVPPGTRAMYGMPKQGLFGEIDWVFVAKPGGGR